MNTKYVELYYAARYVREQALSYFFYWDPITQSRVIKLTVKFLTDVFIERIRYLMDIDSLEFKQNVPSFFMNAGDVEKHSLYRCISGMQKIKEILRSNPDIEKTLSEKIKFFNSSKSISETCNDLINFLVRENEARDDSVGLESDLDDYFKMNGIDFIL